MATRNITVGMELRGDIVLQLREVEEQAKRTRSALQSMGDADTRKEWEKATHGLSDMEKGIARVEDRSGSASARMRGLGTDSETAANKARRAWAKVTGGGNGGPLNELLTWSKQMKKDFKELGQGAEKVGSSFLSMAKMLKFPAMIVGIRALVSAVGALGASGIAAGSALAPLIGYAAVLPGIGLALMSTTKLITATIGPSVDAAKALEKYGKGSKQYLAALKGLAPEQRKFVDSLVTVKGTLKTLQGISAKAMLPGLGEGLAGLNSLLSSSSIVGPLRSLATVIGNLGKSTGTLLRNPVFSRELKIIGDNNAHVVDNLGHALLEVAQALVHIMKVAAPFTRLFSQEILGAAQRFDKWAGSSKGQTALLHFFDLANKTGHGVVHMLSDLGSIILSVGKAAFGLGEDMGGSLLGSLDRLSDKLKSKDGQTGLKKYFDDAKPVIKEVGKIIGDVLKIFTSSGSDKNTLPLLDSIDTKLLPSLNKLFTNVSTKTGPAIVNLISNISEFVGGPAGGALTNMATVLGKLVGGVVDLTNKVPGLGPILEGVFTAALLSKVAGAASGFGSILKSVGKIIGLTGTSGKGGSLGGTLLGGGTKTATMTVYAGEVTVVGGGKTGPGGLPIPNGPNGKPRVPKGTARDAEKAAEDAKPWLRRTLEKTILGRAVKGIFSKAGGLLGKVGGSKAGGVLTKVLPFAAEHANVALDVGSAALFARSAIHSSNKTYDAQQQSRVTAYGGTTYSNSTQQNIAFNNLASSINKMTGGNTGYTGGTAEGHTKFDVGRNDIARFKQDLMGVNGAQDQARAKVYAQLGALDDKMVNVRMVLSELAQQNFNWNVNVNVGVRSDGIPLDAGAFRKIDEGGNISNELLNHVTAAVAPLSATNPRQTNKWAGGHVNAGWAGAVGEHGPEVGVFDNGRTLVPLGVGGQHMAHFSKPGYVVPNHQIASKFSTDKAGGPATVAKTEAAVPDQYVFTAGAVVVTNPSKDVDVERAIARAIARADRDARERGKR